MRAGAAKTSQREMNMPPDPVGRSTRWVTDARYNPKHTGDGVSPAAWVSRSPTRGVYSMTMSMLSETGTDWHASRTPFPIS